ncbi:hypothetical protein FIBSPDRAFT_186160 [Athelia psychrophila]|uniref:MACPF-like domain-containing protein n=1 Tax=Athelia psychrophila TaxID=1759441 RepID=A0A166AB67_9AGAM|nr:hypothetical protein FIBSPDRAFT_186160 [Fibularhizoctonia sp. CBS 109695]
MLPANGAPKSVSNLSVVKEVEAIKMSFISSQEVRDEVTISFTRTAAANASNGWIDVSITGESPWVTGGARAHFQESSFESMSESTVYVNGRHNISQCKVSLPLDLEPNSDFDKAVHAALDHPDETARTKALQEVFDTWGHIFVASVEMGGLKHVSMKTSVTKKEDVASFEADAKVALGSRFVHVQGGGGGVSNTTASVGKVMEKMNLDTVVSIKLSSKTNSCLIF